MKRRIRTGLVVVATGALTLMSAVALTHGWADLLAFQGRSFLNLPLKDRVIASTGEGDLAQARLERALELDAANPALREDLGRMLESRSRARPADNAAALERSLAYLRSSLAVRPTSPYTWANLAFVKSRLGTLDREFYASVDHAARLGPWEPEVQLLLADIGFRYWNRMPKDARDTIHAAIGRGLKRQDEKLFDLAARYGRVDVMCSAPGVFRSKRAIRCI